MPTQVAPTEKFTSGPFVGVDKHDAFAVAALKETTVVVKLAKVAFPSGLAPTPQTFKDHTPGTVISTAVNEATDVMVLLYTDQEISALLDVFTNNNSWSTERKKTWYWYGHNFNKFKPLIQGGEDDALKAGVLGYLFPMTVGNQRVVFYKSELHPKGNGDDVPFIPVIQQLVGELAPKLVISTGTAGGIGSHIQCGDVAITSAARFHLQKTYSSFPQLNTLSKNETQLTNAVAINDKYVKYAAENFTQLSLPGLQKCYADIGSRPGYSFLKENTTAPSIYAEGINPAPAPQPMDVVSADYLTVDDATDNEGLQNEGIMNDTDDAFAFFAIDQLPKAQQPQWLSVRNASEPQIVIPNLGQQSDPSRALSSLAGAIYGVYQYCTTLNSAFACWGVIAGMN